MDGWVGRWMFYGWMRARVCGFLDDVPLFFPSVSAGDRVGVAAGGGGEVREADPSQVRGGGKNRHAIFCAIHAGLCSCCIYV